MSKLTSMSKIEKLAKLFFLGVMALSSLVGYLSIQYVSDEDSPLEFSSKLISKSIVMNFLHVARTIVDKDYIPTPFDDKEFEYVDLNNPAYLDIISNDILAPFSLNSSKGWQLNDAIEAMDILNTHMTVGASSKDWSGKSVAEMYAAGLDGEAYLCGDLARMYIMLVQSKGLQARKIGLNRADGIGHVVVEVYDPISQRWLLFDPTNNLYYVHNKEILNALELNHLLKDDNENSQVKVVVGESALELGSADRYDALLDFYRHGIVVEFFNNWVETKVSRLNPIRSPSVMGIYVGSDPIRKIYYRHDLPPEEYEENYRKLYASP